MKIKFLDLALKNVMRNTRRTMITSMIMIFGAASLIIAGGFFKYSFWGLGDYAIRKEYGHLQILNPELLQHEEDMPLQYGISHPDSLIDLINAMEHVKFAMPRIEFMGLISNGDKSVAYIGRAGIPEKEKELAAEHHVMVKGKYLGEDASGLDEDEVILASGLAKSLKAETGDYMTLLVTTTSGALNAIDVKVVGVFSTGIPEMDARFLSVKVSTAQQVLRSKRVSKLVVVLDDTKNTDIAAEELAQILPDFTIKKWYDLAVFYQSVVKLYTTIFTFMGLIIFIIVLLASSNTMMMSIFERTKEIGTLMAVGTSSKRVLGNFLLEGLIIGTFSAIMGVIFALIFSFIINHSGIIMPPPPGSTTPYALQVHYVLAIYIGAFIFIIVTAVLSALFPALRASKTKIVDALGHI